MIRVKRIYDPSEPADGSRFLVERLWPRGMKKEALRLDNWPKVVAPSDALRRRFGHVPANWNEFQRRYVAELNGNREAWQPILEAARGGNVTLLYSARDRQHNSALVLKTYLEAKINKRRK